MKKKKIFGAKQVVMAALLAALGGAVWLTVYLIKKKKVGQ